MVFGASVFRVYFDFAYCFGPKRGHLQPFGHFFHLHLPIVMLNKFGWD